MFPLLLNKLFSAVRRPQPPGHARVARRRLLGGSRKRINLALQGGGAHGAFTWGVLDHILSDDRITIDGISGASAGAVNAVMLADGFARGGAEEAQRRLAEFWRAASFGGNLPDLQRGVVERLFSLVPNRGSAVPWLGTFSGFLSPYDLNPLNINPLKDLIERFVDFDLIRGGKRQLFVSATNVHTGEPRVFTREEITAEVVMASACLPLLSRAVEIDGEPYWDGGYSGNPAILPFRHSDTAKDVLIVQINPLERRKVPTTAREIMARLNEITFNASLLAELRALELADTSSRLRLHRIVMDDLGDGADASGKLNTDYDYFEMLRKRGQRATRRFLDEHLRDIGRRSTIHVNPMTHAEVA
jgi:NTE family protein